MKNGLIVVKKALSWYHGVDRDTWPLQYIDLELHNELCKKDYKMIQDDITNSMLFAQTYASEAHKQQLLVDLLYCEFYETSKNDFDKMLYNEVNSMIRFLGWDFSYDSGDFYSCINNDVSLHADLFRDVVKKMNIYGLFSSRNDLDEFVACWDAMMGCCPREFFETDTFYPVKVYKI